MVLAERRQRKVSRKYMQAVISLNVKEKVDGDKRTKNVQLREPVKCNGDDIRCRTGRSGSMCKGVI
jgi:hypothetical protein